MVTTIQVNRQTSVAVICPCYNEEDVIEHFYTELVQVLDQISDIEFTILFIDDGSSDDTLHRINGIASRDTRVQVYSFSRNFGHQVALSAGLDHAAADAVVLMDSDLQHPPSLIAEMISAWQEGYEVVSAVRVHTKGVSVLKRVGSNCFYWLFNMLSDVALVPGAADFCLLSSQAQQALTSMPERHRFLRGMISWIGFRRYCIRYEANERAAGKSKYTTSGMFKLACDAVFSFSPQPMRMATRLGLFVTASGAGYLVYILARALILGDLVPGWGSLISVVLIMGGVQLAFLGVIGEYVARIFEEAKGRPLYVFRQTPAMDV